MKQTVLYSLLVVSAVLLGATAVLWVVGERHWQAPESRPPEANSITAEKIEPRWAEVAELAQTVERPLFAKDRRPEPVVAVASEASPEPDPFKDVAVLGVFEGAEGGKGAILRSEGAVRRVRVGEAMGLWTLTAAEGSRLTFQNDETVKYLQLKHLPQQAARVVAPAPVAGEPKGAGAEGTPHPAAALGAPPASSADSAPAPRTNVSSSSNRSGGSSLAKRIAERRARLGLNKN